MSFRKSAYIDDRDMGRSTSPRLIDAFHNRGRVGAKEMIALMVLTAGCAPSLDGGVQSPGLGLRTVCFINRQNSSPTVYTGPDGRALALTRPQCIEANEEAQRQDLAAEQARQAKVQLATQRQREEQQRSDAATAQAVRDEKARGYQHVTVKDLLLDAKILATRQAKIAVSGFYKTLGRRNERLYVSYNDFMMHAYQSVQAQNVGLLTADGSRRLREHLLRCVAGCELTILGHVTECVETSALGTSTPDFCLVADDMRVIGNGT